LLSDAVLRRASIGRDRTHGTAGEPQFSERAAVGQNGRIEPTTLHTLELTVRAPGRVNLIGDHTDYTGGFCLPMAIDRSIEIHGAPSDDPFVRLATDGEDDAVVGLDVERPDAVEPEWARYVAGVVAEARPSHGFRGIVSSTLPAGAGLSSSAALEVACALALGVDASDPVALAGLCQRAEHRARGVPTGLLDQLAVIGGVAGHGLLLDCTALTLTPVLLPPPSDAEWVVIHAGARSLAQSGYTDRVHELAAAEAVIGPVRNASLGDVEAIPDPVVRRRARHVVSENQRVHDFAAAIGAADLAGAGELMTASHASLSNDFESSTAAIDELCRTLVDTSGVLGARITGGGWGGCVVALARPGAIDPTRFDRAWVVEPSAGATVRH
jgi:galactokinase